jgi:hypothetical protein
MGAPQDANSPSALLHLPLELRDIVYSLLLQPQHVYTASAQPGGLDTYTIRRSKKDQLTYLDTRIYLPARIPGNILQTCKQLREESLDFYAHYLNSFVPVPVTDSTPPETTSSQQLTARTNTTEDESMERTLDEGVVRITLEILRSFRGAMGSFVPVREDLSPHFMALLPLLGRIKKMKLAVWAGYDWWSGNSTRPIVNVDRVRRLVRYKRTWSDQTDVPPPDVPPIGDDTNITGPSRPDHLATAIDKLLHHLPLLEELSVDVLLHIVDFASWDLPEEIKWEGIRAWLDGPVSPLEGGRLKKVQRRLLVVHLSSPMEWGTFLRQSEVRREGEDVVDVERGVRMVS